MPRKATTSMPVQIFVKPEELQQLQAMKSRPFTATDMELIGAVIDRIQFAAAVNKLPTASK